MTFENAAYAINGAKIGAALARRALYAEARTGGIVQADDLKVSPLDVPGVGVQISEGVALVLNDYQTIPNEVYVASNPGGHTIPSSQMPAAGTGARSFIVAVVIGDPDFTQAGHPWMPSEPIPAEQKNDFQYVRPTLIQVDAGVTTLDVGYPALPLARIDLPANTTTVTGSMIVDLRQLASPRSAQDMFVSSTTIYTTASPVYIPAATDWATWGAAQYSPTVKVPAWAKRALIVAHINGVGLADTTANVTGAVRAKIGNIVSPSATFDFPVGTGAVRANLMAAGEIDVSSMAGTNQLLRIDGFQNAPASPPNNRRLRLQGGTQIVYDVRFFEQ